MFYFMLRSPLLKRDLRESGVGHPHQISQTHPSGGCRIRTCEGVSHQIYSLTPLTARETPRKARLLANSFIRPRGPVLHNLSFEV